MKHGGPDFVQYNPPFGICLESAQGEMYTVKRSALVTHSAPKMFTLVDDVARYQEFLPWCGGSEEISRSGEEVVASIKISYKGIEKSFTTCNKLEGTHRIALTLVDGPFSELHGSWEFIQLEENASKVVLDLQFDFSNRLLGAVVGPIFRRIADSMVDSFVQRADRIYAPDRG